jgi:hypothetical protein
MYLTPSSSYFSFLGPYLLLMRFISNALNPLWRVYQLLGNDSVNTCPRLFYAWSAPRPLLCNGVVNTPKTIRDNKRRCFPWGPWKTITKKNSIAQHKVKSRVPRRQPAGIWAWEQRIWIGSYRITARGGIGGAKEISCVPDCYKSVARIRQVKTENPSACVTVNGKVCIPAMALYCP